MKMPNSNMADDYEQAVKSGLGKTLEKYLWRSSFVKVAGCKPATLLKMNFFTHIFQGF